MEDKYVVIILVSILIASTILAYFNVITGDQWMQIALTILAFITGYGYGFFKGRFMTVKRLGKWAKKVRFWISLAGALLIVTIVSNIIALIYKATVFYIIAFIVTLVSLAYAIVLVIYLLTKAVK